MRRRKLLTKIKNVDFDDDNIVVGQPPLGKIAPESNDIVVSTRVGNLQSIAPDPDPVNMKSKFKGTIKKVMTQAINLMFDFLKNKERVSIWLYENTSMKLEGQIIGFDEYMNLTLDDAYEVHKGTQRKSIGRIMLKGDCICLIQSANPQ